MKLGTLSPIVLLVAWVSAGAQAQLDWTNYFTSPGGDAMDWSSSRTKAGAGGVVTTWVRETMAKRTPIFPSRPVGPLFKYSINRIEISCGDSTYRYVTMNFYDTGDMPAFTQNMQETLSEPRSGHERRETRGYGVRSAQARQTIG